MSIVTVEEAKEQLRIKVDDDRDEEILQAYVDGITAVIENYKREVIEQRTVTEIVEVRGGRRFRVWAQPIISLTSASSLDGSRSWDVTGARISTSGIVTLPTAAGLPREVEIVCEAGYVDIPENYKRGALVALQHVWETRRGVGTVGMGVVGGEERYDHRYSYSIPRKALEWLGAPNPVVA